MNNTSRVVSASALALLAALGLPRNVEADSRCHLQPNCDSLIASCWQCEERLYDAPRLVAHAEFETMCREDSAELHR